MIYAIASYHRPECKTIKTLLKAGVDVSDIVISVQEKEDFEIYSNLHRGIKIIYREGSCLSENRNNILDNIKERPICLLDDDITSFCYYEGRKFITDSRTALEKLSELAEQAKRNGCELCGIAATANAIIAGNRPVVGVDMLCQGTVVVILSEDLRYDETQKMVQDYEICLRIISKGGHVLRGNHLSANKPQNGTNKGGLHEEYLRGENKYWHKVLAKKYPMYKINKKGTGGTIVWK